MSCLPHNLSLWLNAQVLAECLPVLIFLLPHHPFHPDDISAQDMPMNKLLRLIPCLPDYLNLHRELCLPPPLASPTVLILFRCVCRKSTSFSIAEPLTSSSYYVSSSSAIFSFILSRLTMSWYPTISSRPFTFHRHTIVKWLDIRQPTTTIPYRVTNQHGVTNHFWTSLLRIKSRENSPLRYFQLP